MSNRSQLDIEKNFHYGVNDEGLEYLIAHATIKKVTDNEILTEEWPHLQMRGDFFPKVASGQKWRITYSGNTPWTSIISAELLRG